MKRQLAQDWFNEPVPADTDGYFDVVTRPMDYGTISASLAAGAYETPEAFAADVRQVTANAVLYSPEPDNECHRAARQLLVVFEKAYLRAKLISDGGDAVKAAEEAAKGPAKTRKRGRASE